MIWKMAVEGRRRWDRTPLSDLSLLSLASTLGSGVLPARREAGQTRRAAEYVAGEDFVAGKDGTADDHALIADGIHLSRTHKAGPYALWNSETVITTCLICWTSEELSFDKASIMTLEWAPRPRVHIAL